MLIDDAFGDSDSTPSGTMHLPNQVFAKVRHNNASLDWTGHCMQEDVVFVVFSSSNFDRTCLWWL